MSGDCRSAIVLSGGGAYAAYEVGVMTALFLGLCPSTSYSRLRPDILTGTSAGAVNAALLLSGDSDPAVSVHWLQETWADRLAGEAFTTANSAFRIRGNLQDVAYPPSDTPRGAALAELLDDGVFLVQEMIERGVNFVTSPVSFEQRVLELWDFEVLVSADPFRRLLSTLLNATRIQRSQVRLRVAATNWRTGQLCLFGNEHMADDRTARNIVLASAAIPGLFPSVEIDGDPYVDGGVVMNTPLKPAIDAGADVLHVIYVDPDVELLPLPRLRSTYSSAYRTLVIGFARAMNDDIATAHRVNVALAAIRDGRPSADRAAMHLFEAGSAAYRPLQIHRYHPRDDLGGPFRWLTFDRDQVLALMVRGLVEAANHDCAANRCEIRM